MTPEEIYKLMQKAQAGAGAATGATKPAAAAPPPPPPPREITGGPVTAAPVQRVGGPTMDTRPANPVPTAGQTNTSPLYGGSNNFTNTLPKLETAPVDPAAAAKARIDAGLQFGENWVKGQVPDGVLGRHTDSYRGNVDNLLGVQQDNLKGYDSSRMAETARAQAASLAGAGRAFTGKVAGPAAGVAMAPGLQNAAQLYQSGVTADNAQAKDRAMQAMSEYLPRASGEELKMDQANQQLGQKEKTLQATLPFDVAQMLESARSGIIGNADADWLNELVKRFGGAMGNINADINRAQGR